MEEYADWLNDLKANSPHIYQKVIAGLEEPNITSMARFIENGAVAIFYCGTSYAIGTSALNPVGIKRIYQIKERANEKPLSILASPQNYFQWVNISDVSKPYVDLIIQRYWPGEVSLIFPKKNVNHMPIISDEVTSNQKSLHLVCIDKVTELLSLNCSAPIAVSSANLSGGDLITSPIDAIKEFGDKVDYFLVGGESEFKRSTNIVDFSVWPPKLLRKTSEVMLKQLKEAVPDLVV